MLLYMKKEMLGYLIRKLSLGILLTLVMISFLTFSITFFQNQFQLVYSLQQTSITNNSNYSSKNEISNALLEQFTNGCIIHRISLQ
jgi:hypothetical protein